MIEALFKKKCLLEYIKPNDSSEEQKEHKSKEDTKTSSILGTLTLLPDRLLRTILLQSVSDSINNTHKLPGRILDVEFWPHWKYHGTKDGDNQQFVEPDVVLKLTDNQVVIIEAKNDLYNPQDEEQWRREITAAENEGYKVVSLIALDGNHAFNAVSIEGVPIWKTSWALLLNAVIDLIEKLQTGELIYFSILKLDVTTRVSITDGWIRTLRQVQKAFALFEYFPTQYMDSIPNYTISQHSTEYFNKFISK